jgi:adenylate kinase family enzyme
MRVLMIAPPGAGKGTQGALIAAHLGIPHIATGDLLRDHVARRTDLGRACSACSASGRNAWPRCGRRSTTPTLRRPRLDYESHGVALGPQ